MKLVGIEAIEASIFHVDKIIKNILGGAIGYLTLFRVLAEFYQFLEVG